MQKWEKTSLERVLCLQVSDDDVYITEAAEKEDGKCERLG